MSTEKLEIVHMGLNHLLDDFCIFLTNGINKLALSTEAKEQADNLIERSIVQKQKLEGVLNDLSSGGYIDMQTKIILSENKREKYINNSETMNSKKYFTLENQQLGPYSDFPAKNLAYQEKSGYIELKTTLLKGFEQFQRIFAGTCGDWLLIYSNKNDEKPIHTFHLKIHKAEAIATHKLEKNGTPYFSLMNLENQITSEFLVQTYDDLLQWVARINKYHHTREPTMQCSRIENYKKNKIEQLHRLQSKDNKNIYDDVIGTIEIDKNKCIRSQDELVGIYEYIRPKEFLPQSCVKIEGVDKKVFAVPKKHQDLGKLESEVLCTKNALDLKTYGVTLFLVKEKMKDENKLIPRLLGVTKDSVLRLEKKTYEILQTWALTKVRRWTVTPNTFTLDFGDYSDHYYTVHTTEGEQIQQIIYGYIDIILKKKQAKGHLRIEGDENSTMFEDSGAPHKMPKTESQIQKKIRVKSKLLPSTPVRVKSHVNLPSAELRKSIESIASYEIPYRMDTEDNDSFSEEGEATYDQIGASSYKKLAQYQNLQISPIKRGHASQPGSLPKPIIDVKIIKPCLYKNNSTKQILELAKERSAK